MTIRQNLDLLDQLDEANPLKLLSRKPKVKVEPTLDTDAIKTSRQGKPEPKLGTTPEISGTPEPTLSPPLSGSLDIRNPIEIRRQEKQRQAIKRARDELAGKEPTPSPTSAISQGISQSPSMMGRLPKPRIERKPGETVDQAISRAKREAEVAAKDAERFSNVIRPTPRGPKPDTSPIIGDVRQVGPTTRPDWPSDASAWERFKTGVNPNDIAAGAALGLHGGALGLADYASRPKTEKGKTDTTSEPDMWDEIKNFIPNKVVPAIKKPFQTNTTPTQPVSTQPLPEDESKPRRLISLLDPVNYPSLPTPPDRPVPPKSDTAGRAGKRMGKLGLYLGAGTLLNALRQRMQGDKGGDVAPADPTQPQTVEIWNAPEPAPRAEPAPIPRAEPAPAPRAEPAPIPRVREPDIKIDQAEREAQARAEREAQARAEREAQARSEQIRAELEARRARAERADRERAERADRERAEQIRTELDARRAEIEARRARAEQEAQARAERQRTQQGSGSSSAAGQAGAGEDRRGSPRNDRPGSWATRNPAWPTSPLGTPVRENFIKVDKILKNYSNFLDQ
jgi:hypothetical protein